MIEQREYNLNGISSLELVQPLYVAQYVVNLKNTLNVFFRKHILYLLCGGLHIVLLNQACNSVIHIQNHTNFWTAWSVGFYVKFIKLSPYNISNLPILLEFL